MRLNATGIRLTRLIVLCVLAVFNNLTLAIESPGVAIESSVQITLSNDKEIAVQLEARQAPLLHVLNEIAAKTGVRLHYSVLPEDLVTATCAGETVKQVMECLLGSDAGLISRYGKGKSKTHSSSQLEEIWVLGSRFDKDGKKSTICTITGAKLLGLSNMDKKASTAEQNSKSMLIQMAQAQDSAMRAQALAQLVAEGKANDAEVRVALQEAMSDNNADVRAQAVFGLAQQDSAESAVILQEALHDENADVRMMAVENARSDTQGQAILRQALSDADETVRALAAQKLGIGIPGEE